MKKTEVSIVHRYTKPDGNKVFHVEVRNHPVHKIKEAIKKFMEERQIK